MDNWLLLIVFSTIFFLVSFYFILKNPINGIYLIIFFLPFERIGALTFGGVTGLTIRVSQMVVILTLLGWLWFSFVKREIRFQKNVLLLPMLIYILISGFSTLGAFDASRAQQVWMFTTFTILASWLVVNLINGKENLKKIIWVLLVSALIVSLFGLYQFVGDIIGLPQSLTGLREIYTKRVFGFPRIQSTALEPLLFANYLLIPICLGAALYLDKKIKINRQWLLLILILLLVNFVLTLSRGAYLGLAVSGLVIAVFYFRHLLTLRNIVILLTVVIVVTLAVVGFIRFSGVGEVGLGEVQRRMVNILQDASASHRLINYKAAWEIYQHNGTLGIGPGNFGPHLEGYYNRLPQHGWATVNNQYLETLAETGILGFLSLMLITVVILITSIRAYLKSNDHFLRATMLGLAAAFIGILIEYNFFSTLYVMHIWVLIGLMIAIQNLIHVQDSNADVNHT